MRNAQTPVRRLARFMKSEILNACRVEFSGFIFNVRMKALHMIAWILLIIGGLNWLLIGIGGFVGANWNVIDLILGSWPMVEWIIYILVGLSAIYELVTHRKNCRTCSTGSSSM